MAVNNSAVINKWLWKIYHILLAFDNKAIEQNSAYNDSLDKD